MNADTADTVIAFLKAAGVARLTENEEGNLLVSLDCGASEYVTFDCDIGPDTPEFRSGRDAVQMRMPSKARPRPMVTCRYSERLPEHAVTVATLHLRVARLAMLIEVLIEACERDAKDPHGDNARANAAIIQRMLADLDRHLDSPDVASIARTLLGLPLSG